VVSSCSKSGAKSTPLESSPTNHQKEEENEEGEQIKGPRNLSPTAEHSQSPLQRSPEVLLVCIHQGRDTTKVVSIDISSDFTDKDVYTKLRQEYTSRKHLSWLRLKGVSHIEWRQFHIYHTDRAAISTHNGEDWPQCHRDFCRTGCASANGYKYSPHPSQLDPPIPREAMMHFFKNPSHAGTKTFQRATMPKHHGSLKLRADENLCTGWGFVFIERISWMKVAVIEAAIGIISLIFVVSYGSSHNGSLLEAFGPSAWMMSIGAVILTLLSNIE